MKRPLIVVDLFCGGGGTSTGAIRALRTRGLDARLVAVNHWDVAIETHKANHPEARHFCMNLEGARPIELVPEGRADIIMASPECTHHSRARGGKPVSDQTRASAWHVIRWCTELRVRAILVENVPEFQEWGPVDPRTDRPVRSRAGEYFRAWVVALEAIGFRCDWRVLNAADFGGAQTRERFFLIGRSDRKPVTWPQATHAKTGGASDALFDTGMKRWRAAREVIDFDIPAPSIFGRKRPLSPKTLARIYAGARKFRWPDPFLVILRNHMDGQSIDAPFPTITAGGTHIGLAQPFLLPQRSDNEPSRTTEDPLSTVTTVSRLAVILPQGGGGAARPIDEPVATIATDGAHALVTPYYRTGVASPVERPLPSVTTHDRFGLVMPVTHGGDRSVRARSLEAPLPTVTGARRGDLAFIAAAFGERPGQPPRVHDIDAPAPSVCATGRVQLVEGIEVPRYDIRFRMLTPRELALAQGFPADYVFHGNKTEITKQVGNAVEGFTAEALIGAIADGGGLAA